MSSSYKIALVSAVILAVVVVGYFLASGNSEPAGNVVDTQGAEAEDRPRPLTDAPPPHTREEYAYESRPMPMREPAEDEPVDEGAGTTGAPGGNLFGPGRTTAGTGAAGDARTGGAAAGSRFPDGSAGSPGGGTAGGGAGFDNNNRSGLPPGGTSAPPPIGIGGNNAGGTAGTGTAGTAGTMGIAGGAGAPGTAGGADSPRTNGTGGSVNPDSAPGGATAGGGTYTIRSGDTFSSIAAQLYGNERYWVDIAQANPLVDPARLRVGQTIRLPAQNPAQNASRTGATPSPPVGGASGTSRANGGGAAPTAGGVTYTVQSGDTLSSIAEQYYGTNRHWRRLYDANRQVIGADPNRLEEGMRLTVPPAGEGAR